MGHRPPKRRPPPAPSDAAWSARPLPPGADIRLQTEQINAVLDALVMRPPAPKRLPLHDEESLIGRARDAYAQGRIEVEDFERALDHIFAGGRGCAVGSVAPSASRRR